MDIYALSFDAEDIKLPVLISLTAVKPKKKVIKERKALRKNMGPRQKLLQDMQYKFYLKRDVRVHV